MCPKCACPNIDVRAHDIENFLFTPAPVMAAAKATGKPAPVYRGPKLEFNEKQKLMLKSQILAYRMMRRHERLQNVVIQAATDKNFKNSNFPKSDLNLLSSLFKKEYSK